MDYEKLYKDALEKAKIFKGHLLEIDEKDYADEMGYIFPELRESEDEKVIHAIDGALQNKTAIEYLNALGVTFQDAHNWLEKQGKQASAIRWYDVSLIPQEMEELLVEWDSEDATWHEIAFYHADTKTFWDGTRQVENVTRWCYIDDILEKQAPKSKWSDDDEQYLLVCKNALRKYQVSDKWDAEIISKWLEDKLKH